MYFINVRQALKEGHPDFQGLPLPSLDDINSLTVGSYVKVIAVPHDSGDGEAFWVKVCEIIGTDIYGEIASHLISIEPPVDRLGRVKIQFPNVIAIMGPKLRVFRSAQMPLMDVCLLVGEAVIGFHERHRHDDDLSLGKMRANLSSLLDSLGEFVPVD